MRFVSREEGRPLRGRLARTPHPDRSSGDDRSPSSESYAQSESFHRPSHARLAPRPGPGFLPLDHGCSRGNSSSERPPEKAAGLGQTTAQACATGLGVLGMGAGVSAWLVRDRNRCGPLAMATRKQWATSHFPWPAKGRPSERQISLARLSGISTWRGIASTRPVRGLHQSECSFPSRLRKHPCLRR